MLESSLGSGGNSGGLNPLYQIGGSRSVQLALKLVFQGNRRVRNRLSPRCSAIRI
jgi:hypothetical protein